MVAPNEMPAELGKAIRERRSEEGLYKMTQAQLAQNKDERDFGGRMKPSVTVTRVEEAATAYPRNLLSRNISLALLCISWACSVAIIALGAAL